MRIRTRSVFFLLNIHAAVIKLVTIGAQVTRHVSKTLTKAASGGGEDLRIVEKGEDGREWLIASMKDRDQAFSQIIGFADVKWQVVW